MPLTCTAYLQTGLMDGILSVAWYIATGTTSGKTTMPGPKNNVERIVKADQVAEDLSLSEMAAS
jgi:hypothetical protein